MISACTRVAESHFFAFSPQYLNPVQLDEVDILEKMHKSECPTRHKSFIRSRPFLYSFMIEI